MCCSSVSKTLAFAVTGTMPQTCCRWSRLCDAYGDWLSAVTQILFIQAEISPRSDSTQENYICNHIAPMRLRTESEHRCTQQAQLLLSLNTDRRDGVTCRVLILAAVFVLPAVCVCEGSCSAYMTFNMRQA